MLEILKRKKVDKQDKQMPQSIEQLIEHYDLEKLWPYIEKIASHVNVNIEGIEDIEKNGVVSGDTVPIGAVIDYDGDTVPENWEEVSDDKIILYENENGTSGNVTFTQSKGDAKELDIHFSVRDVNYIRRVPARGNIVLDGMFFSSLIESFNFSIMYQVNDNNMIFNERTGSFNRSYETGAIKGAVDMIQLEFKLTKVIGYK